jgi:hypothetical protein
LARRNLVPAAQGLGRNSQSHVLFTAEELAWLVPGVACAERYPLNAALPLISFISFCTTFVYKVLYSGYDSNNN